MISPVGAGAALGAIAAAQGTELLEYQEAWHLWSDFPDTTSAARVVHTPAISLPEDYRAILTEQWLLPVMPQKTITKADLDAWVYENSHHLIEESGLVPDDRTTFVLQNCVTMSARWDSPFNPAATEPAPFTVAEDTTVEVDMMRQANMWLPYVQQNGWRGIRLDYVGKKLAAFILIPKRPEKRLPTCPMRKIVKALRVEPTIKRVTVGLPKVDMASSLDLSRLFPTPPPWLGEKLQAVQQARLIVDEEKTEAAAVTEVMMRASAVVSEPAIEMVFDHPYVFIVADVDTGTPLFMVRVVDPSKSSSGVA